MNKHFIIRTIGVLLAVIMMGFSISWLNPCGFGTDSYTAMNLAIAARLSLSLGNWQALINIILFLIVLLAGRKNIGIGTLANMLLVGYSYDFFTWIWSGLLPTDFFAPLWVRICVAIPALIWFVVSAAFYMDMELGTSPYDAIPFIIQQKLLPNVPFKVIRISYDLLAIVIGYLFGAPFAIATIAMAFLLGPAVEKIGMILKKIIPA